VWEGKHAVHWATQIDRGKMMMDDKIKLGVSACLLGEEVRYDGGHKKDRFITQTLANYLEFVPVCPEVEAGFGVPRESMHLEGDPDAPQLITTKSKRDVTEQMQTWAGKRVQELESEDLCGFIFKSRSPSSGMARVKVFSDKGMPAQTGVGLFARAFMDHFPLIPVEEEGRLHDNKLRENFIESIFVLKRWRACLQEGKTRGKLVTFHTQQKLLIMAHSVQHYRTMGKLVAEAKKKSLTALFDAYQKELMEALRLKTTVKKNANVLMHLMGYFKKDLSGDEKQELLEIFDHYRKGHVPLIVPITLINHYVRKYDQPYLKQQYYLHPHPIELQLRNHA
jgi:uncharacterized protein YbgA (DUF1722 family)/uncharacterized protein YbbK (DUF523 family)